MNVNRGAHTHFECVKEYQYLGANITHDNDLRSEIRKRIQEGNKCPDHRKSLYT